MTGRQAQRVFISYRRSDCQAQANGLHDGLRHRLTGTNVFMDIDSIPPGVDFEEHIRGEIEVCDVVLVLIGDDWLQGRPGSDVRRLDEENDFVRLEVESSLASERVTVIPVLVEGAQMPRAEELPESIRRLARINAFELSDRRWTPDIVRLCQVLENMHGPARVASSGRDAKLEALPEVPLAEQSVTLDDLDGGVIAAAVRAMPGEFKTKDVSESAAVLRAHERTRDFRNFHTMVGRFLANHRLALGLTEPVQEGGGRGATWRRMPLEPAGPQAPQFEDRGPVGAYSSPVQPYSGAQPWVHQAAHSPSTGAAAGGSTKGVALLMILLPLASCGLASFVPPLWVAVQRGHDKALRRRMWALSVALGAATLIGFALVGTAPTDSNETPTGAASNIGVVLLLGAMLVGIGVAIAYRQAPTSLPGTQGEIERRRLRAQYRRLIATDRAMAIGIHVGRPDLPRQFSDGGLLDLNRLDAQALQIHGGISAEEARRIVELRAQLGGLSSLDDITAYTDLSEATVVHLRDLAVFV